MHWQLEGSLPVRGPHTGGYTVTGVTGHDRLVGSFCHSVTGSHGGLPGATFVVRSGPAVSSGIFDPELSC
jgi:hypothetical protein